MFFFFFFLLHVMFVMFAQIYDIFRCCKTCVGKEACNNDSFSERMHNPPQALVESIMHNRPDIK